MSVSNLVRAIRGPVMLITVGVLFALDHGGAFGFDRTWPLLIIIFGVMKLLERAGDAGQPQPPYAGPGPYSGPGPYTGTHPPAGGTQ